MARLADLYPLVDAVSERPVKALRELYRFALTARCLRPARARNYAETFRARRDRQHLAPDDGRSRISNEPPRPRESDPERVHLSGSMGLSSGRAKHPAMRHEPVASDHTSQGRYDRPGTDKKCGAPDPPSGNRRLAFKNEHGCKIEESNPACARATQPPRGSQVSRKHRPTKPGSPSTRVVEEAPLTRHALGR